MTCRTKSYPDLNHATIDHILRHVTDKV